MGAGTQLYSYLAHLAQVHSVCGNAQEAANLARRVWQLEKKQRGYDHAATLSSQYNYATHLYLFNELEEAFKVMRDCAHRSEKAQGPKHYFFTFSGDASLVGKHYWPKSLKSRRYLRQWYLGTLANMWSIFYSTLFAKLS